MFLRTFLLEFITEETFVSQEERINVVKIRVENFDGTLRKRKKTKNVNCSVRVGL